MQDCRWAWKVLRGIEQSFGICKIFHPADLSPHFVVALELFGKEVTFLLQSTVLDIFLGSFA